MGMENQDYNNKNIKRKYLANLQNNQFLRLKNSLLDLQKDFMELKDIELIEKKIKKEIAKLFNKPIMSKCDMDV